MVPTNVECPSLQNRLEPRGLVYLFADLDELRRTSADPVAGNAANAVAISRSAVALVSTLRHAMLRVLRVIPFVGLSLALHGLLLVAAERAYAPYRLSLTGEPVHGSTTYGATGQERPSLSGLDHPRDAVDAGIAVVSLIAVDDGLVASRLSRVDYAAETTVGTGVREGYLGDLLAVT
jgi:hypothetical protein